MAITHPASGTSRIRSRQRAQSEYKIIFAMSFAFFVLALIPTRAVRSINTLFFGSNGQPRKTLFAEARDAANAVLPYAFIG